MYVYGIILFMHFIFPLFIFMSIWHFYLYSFELIIKTAVGHIYEQNIFVTVFVFIKRVINAVRRLGDDNWFMIFGIFNLVSYIWFIKTHANKRDFVLSSDKGLKTEKVQFKTS